MFENLGSAELILIFLVILIFFGPKKIPDLAANLGKGIRKFRDAKEGFETQIKTAMKEPMEAMQEAKAGFDLHMNAARDGFNEQMQTAATAPAELTEMRNDFNDQIASTQAALAGMSSPPMPTPPHLPQPYSNPSEGINATPAAHDAPVSGGVIFHTLQK